MSGAICKECGAEYTVPNPEVHIFSQKWTANETHHWHAALCDHKKQKLNYEVHVDAERRRKDGRYDVCGSAMPKGIAIPTE